MGHTSRRPCTSLDPLPGWYDDLLSCLQTTIGVSVQAHGWDPVQALAAGWRFSLPAAPVEPVEFYHPAGGQIGERLCLHHPVQLRWHHPASRAEADAGIAAATATGSHSIVAVNNYHLPFRPAYHDVHAAHLFVLNRLGTPGGVARVHDPQPPAYRGPLSREVLDIARASLRVGDESDPFFAGANPNWRWLEVRVEGPQPSPSLTWVHAIMVENLDALLRQTQGPAALATFLDSLPNRVREHGPRALREIYVLGWPAQAEAGLHARFLASVAARHRKPRLAETARAVDHVANGWTGLRISAAHASTLSAPTAPADVFRQGATLLRRWRRCMDLYADMEGLLAEAEVPR